MLKKLKVRNFQAHRDSELDFSSGVNVITGTSDSGKSSLIRAIEWVLKNRPLGGEFVSTFAKGKPTVVDIEFDTGEAVKTRKGNKNSYTINGQTLEALRADVPEEISSLFDMPDFCIQSQHNPYFLLTMSPGEVARFLNKEIGIDIIDRLYMTIDRHKRDTTSQITFLAGKITAEKERVTQLEGIEALAEEFNSLQSRIDEYEKGQREVGFLDTTLDAVDQLYADIDRYQWFIQFEPRVTELNGLISTQTSIQNEIEQIKRAVEQLKDYHYQIETLTDKVRLEGDVKGLLTRLEEWQSAINSAKDLNRRMEQYSSLDHEIERNTVLLHEQVTEYADLLKSVRKCPLCQSELSVAKVNHIVKEITESL